MPGERGVWGGPDNVVSFYAFFIYLQLVHVYLFASLPNEQVPLIAFARQRRHLRSVPVGGASHSKLASLWRCSLLCPLATAHNSEALGLFPALNLH